jgi:hypothetical protein
LKDSIESLEKARQIGWPSFADAVDVDPSLVQAVRNAKTEIFVHGILVQRHLSQTEKSAHFIFEK